jgi:hypothetical protein
LGFLDADRGQIARRSDPCAAVAAFAFTEHQITPRPHGYPLFN